MKTKQREEEVEEEEDEEVVGGGRWIRWALMGGGDKGKG